MVPAGPALYGPIDRNLGHFRRYRRADLHLLARETGLRLRRLRYSNSIGAFGWWINAHILKLDRQSARQIEFFDRWLVPVLSSAERVLPPPCGQSLVAVLEKS
jgi:hypothetical protein